MCWGKQILTNTFIICGVHISWQILTIKKKVGITTNFLGEYFWMKYFCKVAWVWKGHEAFLWPSKTPFKTWRYDGALCQMQMASGAAEDLSTEILHHLLSLARITSPSKQRHPLFGQNILPSGTSLSNEEFGMVGGVITARDSDRTLGPISKKVRMEQPQNSNGEHTRGKVICDVHPSVTLLLLSHFPFSIVKVSHSEKRIMMCQGRENFPLPQAVKHLSWAILKCQHKCVLVYRKKYYY